MDLRGLTDDQIQKAIAYHTETMVVHWWGEDHVITPALVEETHGDGMQLIHVTPIDTRPNYYVLRIDSGVDLENEIFSDHDKEVYGTIKEMLLQMIEGEYDNIDRYEENEKGLYYDDETEPFEYEFPILSWGGGMWGQLNDCRHIIQSVETNKEK
jgi:hypothetical protein